MKKRFRIEGDFLGRVKVPKDAYHGSFTARAMENFKISDYKNDRDFIKVIILIKRSAAIVNSRLKLLNENLGRAIVKACDNILKDENFEKYFPVDVFQAGAGTPLNMNVNEVIANKGSRILGKKLGSYFVNPNDHVNMSQSSNDVIPSAIRITALLKLKELERELINLVKSMNRKSKQFKNVWKVGRTHLMDALPITLGKEFDAYSFIIERKLKSIQKAKELLRELNLGGTAIGTGVNANKRFSKLIVKELNKTTRLNLHVSQNKIALTQSMGDFSVLSSSLKNLSLEIIKICNDFMFMNSGPRAGIREIILPEVEPGSSIMPGKVNPSICEAMIMVCNQVIGNDIVTTNCVKSGNLELNVMTPLIAHNLLESIEILTNGIKMFNERCVKGIKANKERCRELLDNSLEYATRLNPVLGYDKVAEIVREALKKNKSIKEILNEKGLK